jgi:hypothetical protein
MLSDCCKEPSPNGRGGKMLEETLIAYSFSECCVGNIVSLAYSFFRERKASNQKMCSSVQYPLYFPRQPHQAS